MKFLKNFGALIVAVVLLSAMAIMWVMNDKAIDEYKAIVEEQQYNIDALSTFINDDIGPMIDCYIVNKSVRVGEQITEECLSLVSIPEKIAYTSEIVVTETVNEKGKKEVTEEKVQRISVITNINDVVGKYFRVDLNEGALLFTDYVIEEKLDNSARYYEMTVDQFPSTIQVGDYVDIRIQFTYGEDFIALSHRKILSMNLEAGIFTFIFDENDMTVYNSMLLDKAMYDSVTIYMLKYVDDNSQTAAEVYYPINQNLADMLKINPNILEVVKEEMVLKRDQLSDMMGGGMGDFDEERLREVSKYLNNIRSDNYSNQRQNLKQRMEDDAQRAKAQGGY